ncbi:MAG: pilus assembly protein TadG-related protein [Novosphingobium sp.]
MRRSFLKAFLADDSAAIAPLYALGIGALVTVSAVGFDYGRLMALDTELQNAADQAALAAATQLDGSDSAMPNARDAATNAFASAGSAFVNETRFANDGRVTGAADSRPITSLSFRFYDGYDTTTDVPGAELTTDGQSADARVVEVIVNSRRVFYALTPLVNAISSGDVNGRAWATLQNSTCNVPPLMFCLPHTASGAVDADFPTDADIGKGLKLHMKANANDSWAPGNFGFLNISYGTQSQQNRRLGLNTSGAGCIGETVESDPGVRDTESTALNTRFDIYPASNNFACNTGTGDFCPAENTRKDFIFSEVRAIRVKKTDPAPAAPQCGTYDTRSGWTANTAAKGFTEDNCFVSGTCSAVGTQAASASAPNWNASAYMTAHHSGVALSTAAPGGTRYEVYKWELEDRANYLAPERLSSSSTFRDQGANRTYTFTNICAYPQPILGTAVAATDDQKDRRVLTVAAVDCTGLSGRDVVKIVRWVDLFLVKPASQTGSDKEFFTEVIGPAKKANGDSGFQYFGRNKAVLIR